MNMVVLEWTASLGFHSSTTYESIIKMQNLISKMINMREINVIMYATYHQRIWHIGKLQNHAVWSYSIASICIDNNFCHEKKVTERI